MPETDTKAKNKVLETAKARLKKCQEAEHDGRELSKADIRFRAGEQWPADIQKMRQGQGGAAVCLTVNLCAPAVKQLTNDQRQNRGAIKVSPVDSGADPETAEILQGLIRHIEYNSNADVAYDTAFDHAVTGGFGFVGVMTEYEDPRSFYQCIKIRRFRNQFAVYLDPASVEPDGSDAKFGFVVAKLSKEEYEAEYPDSQMASLSDAEGQTQFPDWVDDGGVVVAEYFYIESEKDMAYLLADGTTVLESEAGKPEASIDDREVTLERVKWCKFNGAEILEETDWLGKYIPIARVVGDEYELDGEVVYEGLIRQAKEPQRIVNYLESKKVEAIALAPKAPFIIAEGQIEGHEAQWEAANNQTLAALVYKAQNLEGHLVSPPARDVAEPPIQAITIAGESARQNFRDVTQLQHASYGRESNEKSGKAILARQQQGQTGNFHFVDNLSRCRRHIGRILVDLVPKVYHEPGRVLRVIGEDGSQDQVQVGKRQQGMQGIYDPEVGRYDVIVETGPSYATRRKEAADGMLTIMTSAAGQPLVGVMADLLLKNLDFPGSDDMAERAKYLLPPEIRQQEEGGQPIPAEVQAQIAAMQQQLQALNAYAKEKEKEADTVASKERIAMAQIDSNEKIEMSKRMETQWKLDSQEAIAALKADIEAMKAKLQVDMAEQAREAEAASQVIGANA